MTALFIIDPLARLDHRFDTSLGLMRAFEAVGEPVVIAGASDLTIRRGRPWVSGSRWSSRHPAMRTPREPIGLDEVRFVLPRIEPPVDGSYLAMTRVLDRVDRQRTILTNDPRVLREVCEHTWGLQFEDLAPATVVTADRDELASFIDHHGRAVIKPVDGFGGSGVFLATVGDPNLSSLLESATQRFSRLVVAQEWLSAVEQGNRRLFLVDGRPFGPVVLRLPSLPDFRIGEPRSVTDWTAADLSIAARVGPDLVRLGGRFVGLDVIGGKVVDVNVTSPGALRKADLLAGSTRLCDALVEHLVSIGTASVGASVTDRGATWLSL